ncbi:MAG: sigma-54 interaction domain-containing protein [Sedimentibacter sp.]
MKCKDCLYNGENVYEIMNYIADGIAIITNKGIYSYVNSAYEQLIGIKAEEIIGKEVDYYVSHNYISSLSVTEVVLRTKKPASIIQMAALTGRELLISGNPVFDEQGELLYVVALLRDVTSLNKVKRELQERTIESKFYQTEFTRLQKEKMHNICYQSKAMSDIIELVGRIASFDATVLITGESGVGKEVIARLIHDLSNRNQYPFIAINCAAIPEELIESELFGYEGGSFTDAKKGGKIGFFEAAKSGTLFLDEIGDLSLKTQSSLLRVLQDKKVRRVGSTESFTVDTRIIAATNKDLLQEIKNGKFREDLFYRINVVPIKIPPLRERKEDILELTYNYIQQFNDKYGLNKSIKEDVFQFICDYDWPGNVRELENSIERLLITSPGTSIGLDTILQSAASNNGSFLFLSLDEYMQNEERRLLQNLYSSIPSTRKLSKLLKVSQATVVRKLQQYGLTHTNKSFSDDNVVELD